MSAPAVEVFPDPEALVGEVADRLLTHLAALQDTGITPHLVLTGGTIADALHREVARRPSRPCAALVDWRRVHFWWGDERFVPSDSADRNARQARQAMLASLPVPPQHIHEMASLDSVMTVEAGAAEYAAELAEHWPGVFDLVMLGIGPDGHVASLFPGSSQLEISEDLVAAVTDSPKPPAERITLTVAAINRANTVWFLASGPAKARAVTTALAEASLVAADTSLVAADTSLPAARVRGRESTTWFVDTAAASGLPSASASMQVRRQ